MKLVRGAWYVVVVALAASLGMPRHAMAQDEGDLGISLGATPPVVTIEDLDGHPVDLSTVVGKKPVLFEFWATWCPLCRALEPKLQAAQRRYGNQMQFVAIAVAVNQSRSSVQRHLATHPLPLQFLWDSNGNAVRAFQAPSTSYVVVLDASGKVAYTGSGEDQDIDAAVRRVVK